MAQTQTDSTLNYFPLEPRHRDIGDILALGFGTTVAMWAVGYVCRMPNAAAPAPLLLALLICCLLAGGFLAGRYSRRGWRAGLYTGLVSSALNLLVIGSLYDVFAKAGDPFLHSAWAWTPGFLLAGGLLGLIGAGLWRLTSNHYGRLVNWKFAFAVVTAGATLLLLIAGGMVTGLNAGLAVPDWPQSFHYNMFLFPLSKMTGGIYYEHTHRLLGSLVGFTAIVQAIYLLFADRRGWMKILAILSVALVGLQGVLGGKRVVDQDTMMAIFHGIFAQLIFSYLCALAVLCSTRWQSNRRPVERRGASSDHLATVLLAFLLICQLVLGALVRHKGMAILGHVCVAALVLVLALACGVRAWGLNPHDHTLRRFGKTLLALVVLQVILGVTALVALGGVGHLDHPSLWQAIGTTAHQVNGALLLGLATMLALWSRRLLVEPAAQRFGVEMDAGVEPA